jgi:hypothetical protein
MALISRKPDKEPSPSGEGDIPKLEDAPAFREAKAPLDALLARRDETERRMQNALARKRSAKPARSPAERASDLLAGGKIVATSPDAEIEACLEEQAILNPAIGKAREHLEDVIGGLSNAACALVRARHDEAVRVMLSGMQMAWSGYVEQAALQAKLKAMGYAVVDHALPSWGPRSVMAMGSPENPNSETFAVKRWAASKGIIEAKL